MPPNMDDLRLGGGTFWLLQPSPKPPAPAAPPSVPFARTYMPAPPAAPPPRLVVVKEHVQEELKTLSRLPRCPLPITFCETALGADDLFVGGAVSLLLVAMAFRLACCRLAKTEVHSATDEDSVRGRDAPRRAASAKRAKPPRTANGKKGANSFFPLRKLKVTDYYGAVEGPDDDTGSETGSTVSIQWDEDERGSLGGISYSAGRSTVAI